MSLIRGLAWGLAGLFVAATIVQLGDQLNLFVQPPNLPASANLVDRVLGSINYRHDVWPFYFAENLLIALGFMVMIGLGLALALRIADRDDRKAILVGSFVTAGLLGAAGQLVLIGSVKASIDIPYCDCGFKEQEIVSQVWALMVTQGASDWLVNGALLLAAIGVAVAGAIFGGRQLSASWASVSYVISALLVALLILGFAGVSDDLVTWLTRLLTGILIPVWAIWLGLRFPSARLAEA